MTQLRFRRAIIDMSSVLWTCLMAGKDEEHGYQVDTGELKRDGSKKMAQVNSAGYGYANSMAHLKLMMREVGVAPHQMIFVVEGENSKAERAFMLPNYKLGRDKVEGQYEQFTVALDMLRRQWKALGSVFVTQDGVESDDVLAYLALNLKGERWLVGAPSLAFKDIDDNGVFVDATTDPKFLLERWVVSGDKDLGALVDPDNHVHHWRRGEVDTNPFGGFPPKFIPLYISLVGDNVDKIPGCPGFGEKAWIKLVSTFGYESLPLFDQLIKDRMLAKLGEIDPKTKKADVDELPELRKVVENAKSVYMSYEVALLRPESVNTRRCPLVWDPGMCSGELPFRDFDLERYMAQKWLVGADNYDERLNFLLAQARVSPFVAFDIETSTGDESDKWLDSLPKKEKDKTPIDIMGSEYTGFSITFGDNLQYTYYVSVDHDGKDGVKNITKAQAKAMIQAVPRSKTMFIHNASFELPVTINNLGDMREEGNIPEFSTKGS